MPKRKKTHTVAGYLTGAPPADDFLPDLLLSACGITRFEGKEAIKQALENRRPGGVTCEKCQSVVESSAIVTLRQTLELLLALRSDDHARTYSVETDDGRAAVQWGPA